MKPPPVREGHTADRPSTSLGSNNLSIITLRVIVELLSEKAFVSFCSVPSTRQTKGHQHFAIRFAR